MTDQTNTGLEPARQIQRAAGRPVEPGLSRRLMLSGMGATLTGAAFGAAALPALSAEPAAAVDPETDGLTDLTLAAVHIERAVAAMATVTMGRWSVKIYSGQPDQYWGFHQESNMVRRAISLHKRASLAVQ